MASILFSLLGVLVGTIVPFVVYRHTVWKDKYKLDIELITEYEKKPCNKYLVEKLFFWLTKCQNTTFDEISLLLNSTHPSRSILFFEHANCHSKVCYVVNENLAIYADGFESKTKRNIKKIGYFISYLICCAVLVMAYTFIISNEIITNPEILHSNSTLINEFGRIIVWIFISLLFLALAFWSLYIGNSISMAENFIKHFNNQPNELHSPIENESSISTELDSAEISPN
ncbi:hypothetical protein ACNSO7_25265 [Yersinia enterocolitica]|uniref:hypothetical protein n=1 Tax=Yersinia enterocolitica TaxID=630 RepID=UPI003AB3B9A0